MSEDDEKRLARILEQTAIRKSVEEEKERVAKEHAENRKRALAEAKPRIDAGVRQILASVSTVAEEIKASGCILKATHTPRQNGQVDIVIRADAPGTGYTPIAVSLSVNELANVVGAEFINNGAGHVRVEDVTHAKLRSALLGVVERVLRIQTN